MASENVGTLARHRPSTISSRSIPRAIRRVAAPTKRSRSPSRRASVWGSTAGPAASTAPGTGFGTALGTGPFAVFGTGEGPGIAAVAAAPGGPSCCRGRARSCGRASRGCRPSWEVGCSVTRGIPSVRAGCMRQSPWGAAPLCPGESGENNGCHRMPWEKGPKPGVGQGGRYEVLRWPGRGQRACLNPLAVVRAPRGPTVSWTV